MLIILFALSKSSGVSISTAFFVVEMANFIFYQLPMRNLEASEKIECLRYLEYGKKIKLAISTTKNAVEIDTPEDLLKANKIINKNN